MKSNTVILLLFLLSSFFFSPGCIDSADENGPPEDFQAICKMHSLFLHQDGWRIEKPDNGTQISHVWPINNALFGSPLTLEVHDDIPPQPTNASLQAWINSETGVEAFQDRAWTIRMYNPSIPLAFPNPLPPNQIFGSATTINLDNTFTLPAELELSSFYETGLPSNDRLNLVSLPGQMAKNGGEEIELITKLDFLYCQNSPLNTQIPDLSRRSSRPA